MDNLEVGQYWKSPSGSVVKISSIDQYTVCIQPSDSKETNASIRAEYGHVSYYKPLFLEAFTYLPCYGTELWNALNG